MTSASSQARGFSLVELITSMAIGSIILLLAVTMLARSGDGYERLGGGLAAGRDARALVSQISADLSSARFHAGSVFEAPAFDWASDRIGFLTLQPDDAQPDDRRIGDLCAVHYYLKDLSIDGKTVRTLMRGFRDSADTFDALLNDDVPALFSPREAIDEPVAFGVVSFEARPQSRNADGRWNDWKSSTTQPPNAIELRIIIARRSIAAKLDEPADWDGGGTHGKLLGKPSMAHRHPDLEIYSAHIRFGLHEISNL